MSNGTATDAPSQTPAYVAFPTFAGFIERLKDHTVPSRIDKSMMSNLSGAVQSHLLSALRFLGLVEGKEDAVTQELRALVEAYGTETFKPALKEVFAGAYAEIIGGLEVSQATAKQLDDAFGKQKLDGTMRERAIRFYLKGLTTAGVPVSPFLGHRKRKSGGPRTKKPKANNVGDAVAGTGSTSAKARTEEQLPEGTQRYPLYFKGKPEGSIVVPKDLSAADCKVIELQLAVLKAYAGIEE